jgi:hypothetical protein
MADDFITQVQRRVAEIGREDAQLAAQEDGVRRKRADLREQMGELQASLRVYREFMGVPADPQPPVGVGLFDDVPMGTIADMAMAVISKRGEPMKVAEITRALESLGKMKPEDEGGRGNYGSVYGTLKRDRRFRLLDAGRFGLVGSTNGSASELEQPAWQSRSGALG